MLSCGENQNQDRSLVCQDVNRINKYFRRYRLSIVYNLASEIQLVFQLLNINYIILIYNYKLY